MTPITKKQYFLSSRKLDLFDMDEHVLGQKYLYTDEKLNITQCKTSDGIQVYILGNAFCTDKKDKSIEEDISANVENNLAEATRFWTGRYVLITENELFTDACGLMSAFYTEKDGEWYVCSSLALLSCVTERKIEKGVKNSGLTWQLLPYTLLCDTKALMCTQKMSFEDGKINILPSMWMHDYTALSTEEKCKAVSDMLVNAVYNINKYSGKRIVLALTGGKDSRVTFSALIKAGVPFSSYTAQHDNISSSDKSVPKKLCDMFGVNHTYIKKKKFSQQKLSDYMDFCGKNSNGADAHFYACGQFSSFGEDAIVLRSGLYEAGQMYSRGIAGADADSFKKGICSYYKDEFGTDSSQKIGFDEWLEYTEENPVKFVDIRDRFYIEQRAGGWVSAIEQSLDINDFTSIQIANCKEVLSVLLSCNETERNNLSLSYETIKYLDSKALEIEINKRTFADKLTLLKSRLKNPVKMTKKFIKKLIRR